MKIIKSLTLLLILTITVFAGKIHTKSIIIIPTFYEKYKDQSQKPAYLFTRSMIGTSVYKIFNLLSPKRLIEHDKTYGDHVLILPPGEVSIECSYRFGYKFTNPIENKFKIKSGMFYYVDTLINGISMKSNISIKEGQVWNFTLKEIDPRNITNNLSEIDKIAVYCINKSLEVNKTNKKYIKIVNEWKLQNKNEIEKIIKNLNV